MIAFLSIPVFVLSFVALSPPSPYVTLWRIALVSWATLVVTWLIQAWAMVSHRIPIRTWSVWFPPALAFSMIVLAFSGVPLRVSYLASRSAMNQAVSDVMSGKQKPSSIHRVGLYPVDRAYRGRGGVVLAIAGTDTGGACLGDVDNNSGFAYWPSRKSIDDLANYAIFDAGSSFHLNGPWYGYRAWCGSG
jgi:hypothetical protein